MDPVSPKAWRQQGKKERVIKKGNSVRYGPPRPIWGLRSEDEWSPDLHFLPKVAHIISYSHLMLNMCALRHNNALLSESMRSKQRIASRSTPGMATFAFTGPFLLLRVKQVGTDPERPLIYNNHMLNLIYNREKFIK